MAAPQNAVEATRWVHTYADMLYNYAVQRVRDADNAKDLVQDTFLAAWRNIDEFKGEASVKNWLFLILKRKIIDHYRIQAKGLTESLQDHDELFFDSNDHWVKSAYPQKWNDNQVQKMESKEFQRILTQCRSKLKDLQNEAFSLKYLEGMASEEICKALSISSSNYWVLIHRAKLQLRACLEKNWFVK